MQHAHNQVQSIWQPNTQRLEPGSTESACESDGSSVALSGNAAVGGKLEIGGGLGVGMVGARKKFQAWGTVAKASTYSQNRGSGVTNAAGW